MFCHDYCGANGPAKYRLLAGLFLFGACMTEFQKITYEIGQLQIELNHLGSCTTKGLSQEQIAQIDERFFDLSKAKQINCSPKQ